MTVHEAVIAAEVFIQQELDTRQSSFLPDPNPEECEYLTDAERALEAMQVIRQALTGAMSPQGGVA